MTSRTEYLLKALLNGEGVSHEPQSRIEKALVACLNREGSSELPEPKSRIENLLHLLADDMANGGTGSATVEGTAIPQGSAPTYVYFNLNNTIEQTNAYLSQLTYVQTDLFEYPVYGICGYLLNDIPILMFAIALKEEGIELHKICVARGNIINDIYSDGKIWGTTVMSEYYENNGFIITDYDPYSFLSRAMGFCTTATETTPLTDFMGLPLGLENEKIKNVLSITPFTASTSSGATAYTVSSVDELPSDAVDGSMAIVPSQSCVGKWRFDETPNFEDTNGEELRFECNVLYICKDSEFSNDITSVGGGDELVIYKEDGWTYITVVGAVDKPIYDTDNDPAWVIELSREITIVSGGNEQLLSILKSTAERLSGGYSLYTRTNGSWVYKCEVA